MLVIALRTRGDNPIKLATSLSRETVNKIV
jgi:hypothetical protein